MNNYNSPENPEFLNEYLVHMKIVKLLADRTIEEYYTDIRLFLRYIYENNHNTGKTCASIIHGLSVKCSFSATHWKPTECSNVIQYRMV